jgi:hypothetical protein
MRELKANPITKERNCQKISNWLKAAVAKGTYCASDEYHANNVICRILPFEVLDYYMVSSVPKNQKSTPAILPSTNSCMVMTVI